MAWQQVISSFIDPGTADKIRLVKDFDDQALVEAFTPDALKVERHKIYRILLAGLLCKLSVVIEGCVELEESPVLSGLFLCHI